MRNMFYNIFFLLSGKKQVRKLRKIYKQIKITIMSTIEINIDDYLSEQEKKELAIEAFKESIKNGIFKGKTGIQLDYEIQRVIGNISHSIVMDEVQKYIPNCEELIKQKTLDVINKSSFNYEVFKKKDAWDKEESLAITYMREVVMQSKNEFQEKIRETIRNYDAKEDIRQAISDEFSTMADTIYKLSELFQTKN